MSEGPIRDVRVFPAREHTTGSRYALRERSLDREAADRKLHDLGSQERELIRNYVARRAVLTNRARTELATAIGSRVRPRLGASFDHLDDDALLIHLSQTAL